ncbi:ATP-binding protein, partial [Candidatus Pacearchaeota archaeon]|nr:ATP-binding protein [Candidatus Pacearchaeota archaeon]
ERLNNKQLQELILKFIPKKQDNQKKFIEINNNINHLDINKSFYRVIYASGYPRTVEPGFLDRIVSLLGDFNLSLQIKPYPIEHMLVDLNKELQKQRADLYAMQSKGIINPSLEIQYNDTRSTLETLQKGDERLFNISLYVTCKADSVSDLDLLTKKVEAELNSIMILPKVAKFRMIQGFKSVLPLGMDEVKVNRNITTRALSAFFPFTSQFLQADNTGVWLGLNKNNIPIIKDIFKLSNPNGVVLAQSGGGKSYFCKLLITRYLLNGTKVIIIDPQGEYKALVKRFGGQIIDLSRESNTLINPLDLMGHDYTEKRLSLMDLMPVMLGGLSEPQKAFLDKAITNAYADKGINMISDTWSNEPPIMEDLLESLTKLVKKATQIENATLRSVINRLDMYVSGVFSFLNKHTNLKFNNNLVCFDLGNMPKQIKPVVMFLVLDYVYMKMKSDISRKILLVDEAWSLLSRTEDAGYILEIVKTCRKFNMGLLLINQEVEDLFNSRAGKSVLANSAYTMLLKQKPSVIKNICEAFHLSPSEREHLLTANIGEGLLIMEDEHSKIKVVASPEENEIITTNADEILDKKVVEKRNNGGASINVDLDKRFYKEKELNKDEVKYLINEGYKLFSQKSIVSGKQEDYILKPRHNESLNHMFVIYDIVDYLKLRGINAEMYTTRMPDIVFSHNGKRYAIEIETGINLKKDRKMIAEKVRNLNSKYDDWFFVVTNRNLVKSYKTFGETLDSRFILRKLKNLLK